MRILMTGASGFIGYAVASRLADRHEVFAVSRNGHPVLDGVVPIAWDLADPLPAGALPGEIDAVLHAAQSRAYRNFPAGAADVFAVNVAATAGLLDYALRAGATGFVLVSSGTVYEPYTGALSEAAAVAPNSLNGASKLAAEALAFAYQGVLSVCALRLFFPYGPGQVDRLIPDVIRRVRAGEPVMLSGSDGLQFAPIFVEDVADVIATALTHSWAGRLNIAGTRLVSLRELTDIIARLLGKQACFAPAAGPAPSIEADLSRVSRLYDVARFLPLEAGLHRTIAG